MSWQREIDEIARRRELARKLGGDEAIAKQHARGRLTIRERIEGITDPGSFREDGPHAGHAEVDEDGKLASFTPANYVVGLAKIGRIEVYFDNMDEPVMTAKDKNFTWGTVGVGSFDDTGNFDNVLLYGEKVKRPGR